MKECFPCRRPGLGYHLTRDIITRPRIEWPRLRATPDPDLVTLASIVPDFPRIGAPIRDFVARDVPRPPGFDVDGVTRLFTPDLINPSSVYKILLFVSCAAAFVYLEGVALIQDLLQEMDYERLEDEFLEGGKDERNKRGALNDTLRERRRGLGWLALVTALAVWCTGVVNEINPFQP